jgi:hypothetical protein
MNNLMNRWKAWLSVGMAVAVLVGGAGVFLLTHTSATADPKDWPAMTMTYSAADGTQVRELSYTSQTSWIERVTEAAPVETPYGTFSDVGSYQQLEGNQYIVYDATLGETTVETLPDGVVQVPRGGFIAIPIEVIEAEYEIKRTEVTTNTKVCFDDTCTHNAPGWKLEHEGKILVFADDARSIPVQVGNFAVTELHIQGAKDPMTRPTEEAPTE